MDKRALSWIHLLPHAATLRCWNVPADMLNLLQGKLASEGTTWLGWEPSMRDLPALEGFRSVVLIKPRGVSMAWLRSQGFQHTRSFAVVPHIHDARWFVSLQGKRVARRAWDMYAPLRGRARLQKFVATLLTQSGMLARVSERVIVAQREPSSLERLFMNAVGARPISISISTGTPSPRRKLTMQLATPAGVVLAYAKYAEHSKTAYLLKQEACLLERLQQTGLKTALVPELVYHGADKDGYVMVTAPFAQQKTGSELVLTHRHMDVLHELASRTDAKHTGDTLQQLQQRVRELQDVLDTQWYNRLHNAIAAMASMEGFCSLPTAIAHGDFAPWNIGIDQKTQQLVVFDWEHSVPDQLLLYDAFHFKTQVDMLVLRKDAGASVQTTLAEMERSVLVQDLRLSLAHVRALYIGYLLDASVQWFEEQQMQSNDTLRSNAEQAMRGHMLDVAMRTYFPSLDAVINDQRCISNHTL